jgi:hypothetical protein
VQQVAVGSSSASSIASTGHLVACFGTQTHGFDQGTADAVVRVQGAQQGQRITRFAWHHPGAG